jgi:hypothetical protein
MFIGGGAMGQRASFKKKEFLEKPEVKRMQDEHKKAFGTAIHVDGYPDMGNGRYAEHLDYEDWVKFNNAQRAHYNLVEVSGPALASCITAGLYQPIIAGSLGISFALGRVIYSMGYNSKGASGRMAGAIMGSLSLFGLFGLNLFYGGMHVKQLVGL